MLAGKAKARPCTCVRGLDSIRRNRHVGPNLYLWLEFERPDMHVGKLSRDGTVLHVLSGKS
jgi:hypothetical protein